MTLAELGGNELSRSFLSGVERGHTSISLRALEIVARRLNRPIAYFVDEREPTSNGDRRTEADQAELAAAYDLLLRCRDHLARALDVPQDGPQNTAGEPERASTQEPSGKRPRDKRKARGKP